MEFLSFDTARRFLQFKITFLIVGINQTARLTGLLIEGTTDRLACSGSARSPL